MTKLDEYLRAKDIRQSEFCDEHGFREPMVSQWCNGIRRPGLANALRLESVTGIPASYWTTVQTVGAKHPRRRASRKAS